MPRKLDKINLEIIKSLMSDARKSAENVIRTSVGINIGKLGFQTALVALEVESDLRKEIERNLSKCPRVLMILQLAEKASLSVLLYGENQHSLGSTIECLRYLPGTNIIYVHHSRPPLFPEAISLHVFPEKNDLTPCERKCSDCFRYQNEQCVVAQP